MVINVLKSKRFTAKAVMKSGRALRVKYHKTNTIEDNGVIKEQFS